MKRFFATIAFRSKLQCLVTLFSNIHISGFFTGKLYRGNVKTVCVPGLNCYSCPASVASCPIGSLQAAFSGGGGAPLAYVSGLLIFFAALFARFVCGWLCPFGWFQELLYKIKTPKLPKNLIPRPFRYIKYGILIMFVIALPVIGYALQGLGSPAFCKFICPAGTLEAGIPLVLVDDTVRSAIGWLFGWKVLLSLFFLAFMLLEYRSFCKFFCPLGAFYSLFNKIAIVGIHVNKEKCTHCNACVSACKMSCKHINDFECIRCGECKKKCAFGAIQG